MSVCVCGAQEKKKVKFADWRSQQRERKSGFWLEIWNSRNGVDWSVRVLGHCKVRWRFWWFFILEWIKNYRKDSVESLKWRLCPGIGGWRIFFLGVFFSKYSGFARRSLAGQNPFLFICTWNCLSYFSPTYAIIIGINCNFCPLNLRFICQASWSFIDIFWYF